MLRSLEAEGYTFGTDQHLQWHELLTKLPNELPLSELKTILCPIIANTPESQERIYELFDKALLQVASLSKLQDSNSNVISKSSKWKWWIFGLSLLLIPLSLIFFNQWVNHVSQIPDTYVSLELNSSTTICIADEKLEELPNFESASICGNKEHNSSSLGVYSINGICVDYKSNGNQGKDSICLQLRTKWFNRKYQAIIYPVIEQTKQDSIEEKQEEIPESDKPLFTFKEYPFEHDIRSLEITPLTPLEAFYQKYGTYLKLLFILLFTLLLGAILKYRQHKRQKLIAELDNQNKPPYVWNIQIEGIDDIELNEAYYSALHQLKQRTADNNFRIDMPKTIEVTIDKGGMTNFEYRRLTRPAEYLLLIDRQSSANHRAKLFNWLYEQFKSQEVVIERFYFDGDIRLCKNEVYPNGLSLKELQHKYYNARLLILGTAYPLLSTLSGKLTKWTKVFNGWEQKSILSPRPVNLWGSKERQLSAIFNLAPSTMQGLDYLIHHLDTGEGLVQEDWLNKIKDSSDKPIEISGSLLDSLRGHYTEQEIKWIATCAIYPSIHWDLTLFLGKQLSTETKNLLTIDTLISINRIPWFIEGEIPKNVRSKLLNWLEQNHPKLLQQTREQLHILLQKDHPPVGSVARGEYNMNLALNEWLITKNRHRKKELEKQIAQDLDQGIEADFAVLKYLDKERTPLDFIVPDKWKKYLNKGGYQGLGLKELWKDIFYWALPLWLLLAALVGWFPSEWSGCEGDIFKYEYQDEKLTLCIKNTSDRVLLNECLAREAIDKNEDNVVDSLALNTQNILYGSNFNLEFGTGEYFGDIVISYDLPEDSDVELAIVGNNSSPTVLVNEKQSKGLQKVLWDENNINEESYIIYLRVNDSGQFKKVNISLDSSSIKNNRHNSFYFPDSLGMKFSKNIATHYFNKGVNSYLKLSYNAGKASFYADEITCENFISAIQYWQDSTTLKALNWCNGSILSGNSYNFKGILIDSNSKTVISNAQIKLMNQETFSDNQGSFSLNLSEKILTSSTLIIEKEGYEIKTYSYQQFIKNNNRKDVIIELLPVSQKVNFDDSEANINIDKLRPDLNDIKEPPKFVLDSIDVVKDSSLLTNSTEFRDSIDQVSPLKLNLNIIENNLEIAKEKASKEGKLILVDFWANWSSPSKWMDEQTYNKPRVISYLNENFVFVRVDIDAFEGTEYKNEYDIRFLPTLLILSSDGREIQKYEESMGPSKFLQVLESPNSFLNEKRELDTIFTSEKNNKDTENVLPKTNIKEVPTSGFSIQVGAYYDNKNLSLQLANYQKKISGEFLINISQLNESIVYKLFIGHYDNYNEANEDKKLLIKDGIKDAFVKDLSTLNHNNANEKPSIVLPNMIKNNIESAKEKGLKENKPILVNFWANWSLADKWMDEQTFSNPEIINYLDDKYIFVRIDIENLDGIKYKNEYDIKFLPTLIFLDSNGEIIKKYEESILPSKLLRLLKEYESLKEENKEVRPIFIPSLTDDSANNTDDLVLNYVKLFSSIAINEMKRTGIPASITLAQGIIESRYGMSGLAKNSNNHFGIKCNNNWTGGKYYHKDDDYVNGKLVKSCFRSYDDPSTSYYDHSDFLMINKRYQFLFELKKTDYKEWAKGLEKAGYSTARDYAYTLIRTIEEFELYKYDKNQ